MEDQTGVTPKRLIGPDCPFEYDRLWRLWNECASGRTHNGVALTPISWQDIHAWVALTQEHLTAEEIRVIKQVDRWWVEIMSAETDKNG